MSQNTSFTRKILEISLTLAEGAFSQGANTKTWRLGCDCTIVKPGLPEKNKATIKIFNMPLNDMDIASTLEFRPMRVAKNRVRVMAGDEKNGLSLAFAGDVTSALPDFSGAPDPAFVIEAIEGYTGSVTPAQNLTRNGEASVADALEGLARGMGYAFVNRGVSVSLRNIAFRGGPMQQAIALARAAKCELIVDDGEMILMPRGGTRDDINATTPVWSESSGMIGYPSFSQKGLNARGLYEPAIKQGAPLKIESTVPKATGVWKVISLAHALQANYPGATAWETTVQTEYPMGK